MMSSSARRPRGDASTRRLARTIVSLALAVPAARAVPGALAVAAALGEKPHLLWFWFLNLLELCVNSWFCSLALLELCGTRRLFEL